MLSRSIATDRYWGQKLARMMAVIGAINGIAPVVSPVAGGLMTDWLDLLPEKCPRADGTRR